MAGQSLAISESLIYVNIRAGCDTSSPPHIIIPLWFVFRRRRDFLVVSKCIRVVDDVGVITPVTNGSVLRPAAAGSIVHDGCHLP